MERATYCVWCGCQNPGDGKKCQQCGKPIEAKENLLVDFLVDHTKDKLKGDIEDGLFDALKNYLLSHLYSAIIAVAFIVTAVAAIVTAVTPSPADHIQQVPDAPVIQQETESAAYSLTQEDKEQINDCLLAFAECMEYTRYVGGDTEFLELSSVTLWKRP